MKAAVHDRYGSPEVVSIRDIPRPTPADDEVLVRVHFSTVNRTDCGLRAADPPIARLFTGLFRPRTKIWGSEFAGTVEAVGKDVREFRPGDEVFGIEQDHFGTHAEYFCISEKRAIAHKPANLSLREAGAITEGMFLAMTYLREMDFARHPKILINGTTGSIGSAALQLAKYFGSDVTAVGNTKNLELLRELGADRMIDYLKEDFTKTEGVYDYVFDAVGKSRFSLCKHLLKPGGTYFSTELGPRAENVFLPLWTSLFGEKKMQFPLPTFKKEDLLQFKKIIEKGAYRPIVDREYTLEQIHEAYRYVETGEKTGNVVIRVVGNE